MPRDLQKLADRLAYRVEAAVEAVSNAALDHPRVVPLLKTRMNRMSGALAHIIARVPPPAAVATATEETEPKEGT
jgi:hypothetical protein